MDKSDIVMCGCSFSTYIDEVNQPYCNIISKTLNCSLLNLAELGASNYFISKQIEYSLNFSPKLVLVGITTPMRFETLDNNELLYTQPKLQDFKYQKNNFWNNDSTEKIISKPLLWYQKNNKKIFDFYTNNYNYEIKKDQDKFIILGATSILLDKNINFILIDFSNILNKVETSMNVIFEDFRKLSKLFPHRDGIHFNQEGHNYLAKKLLQLIEDKNVL